MPEEKTYRPTEIIETPFPGEVAEPISQGQPADSGISSPIVVADNKFPVRKIAHDLIGPTLNTQTRKILQEFKFVQSGAIRIGTYKNGSTGDLSLTPNGLTARNSSGETTFAIDGTTGDATFKGTILAGTVVAGGVFTNYVQVGGAAADVNDGTTTIDGGKITAQTITSLGAVTAGSFAIGSSAWHVDTSGNMWWGSSSTYAGATIKISSAGSVDFTTGTFSGALSAPTGNFGGFSIGSDYLRDAADSFGIASTVSGGDDVRFWAGDTFANRATADFRVTEAGAVTASSITLTNASIGSGSSYTGNAIAAAYIGTLTADNIGAGTISASKIASNTITSNEIAASAVSTDELAANAVTAAKIAAGTITANEIASNAITSDKINANSVTTAKLASSITISDLTTSNLINGSNAYLSAGLKVGGAGASLTGGAFQVHSDTAAKFYNAAGTLQARFEMNDGGKLYTTKNQIELNGFTLTLTSNKTAILPTSQGYKALYCSEAPEVWFFDFCKSKDKTDPLFLEVTEGEMKFIKTDDGEYQVWRRRRGHADKRFEAKTAQEFEANERFLRMARPTGV